MLLVGFFFLVAFLYGVILLGVELFRYGRHWKVCYQIVQLPEPKSEEWAVAQWAWRVANDSVGIEIKDEVAAHEWMTKLTETYKKRERGIF
jgi:hypothetical protein